MSYISNGEPVSIRVLLRISTFSTDDLWIMSQREKILRRTRIFEGITGLQYVDLI